MRILFICTGNTCRSPMAAGYFKSLLNSDETNRVEVLSAGTFAGNGEPASANSIRSARKLGIDISDHKSALLTRELAESADIIVAMTESHKHAIGAISPTALKKTRLMAQLSEIGDDVSDPFGGNSEMYDECLRSMIPGLKAFYAEIKEKLKEQPDEKS